MKDGVCGLSQSIAQLSSRARMQETIGPKVSVREETFGPFTYVASRLFCVRLKKF